MSYTNSFQSRRNRPATITELAEEARKRPWDPSKSLRHWLLTAVKARTAARKYQDKNDYEDAFVEYARAAIILVEKLPTHSGYQVELSTERQLDLAQQGRYILDSLIKLKPHLKVGNSSESTETSLEAMLREREEDQEEEKVVRLAHEAALRVQEPRQDALGGRQASRSVSNSSGSQPTDSLARQTRSTDDYGQSFPPLTTQNCDRFAKIFADSRPLNGLLSGERARMTLLKSRLPLEQLAQIWALADNKQRGQLDIAGFIIAMHLIHSVMCSHMTAIPSHLPPDIYRHASSYTSRLAVPLDDHNTLPMSTVSSLSPAPRPSLWQTSEEIRRMANEFFEALGGNRFGYLDKGAVHDHFMQCGLGLTGETFQRIWDLSDADEDGELNRHEFATALHLFQQGETGVPLPSHLWENGDNPHSSSTTGDTQEQVQPISPLDEDTLSFSTPATNLQRPASIVSLMTTTPLDFPCLAPTTSPTLTTGTHNVTDLPLQSSSSSSRSEVEELQLIDFSDNTTSSSTSVANHQGSTSAAQPGAENNIEHTLSRSSSSITSTQPSSLSRSVSIFADSPSRLGPSDQLDLPLPRSHSPLGWAITPAQKARSDILFDSLDPWGTGYIEDDLTATGFFQKSKLPQDVLRQIWSLADVDDGSKLPREEFAVAIHLIRAKLSGRDLPSILPPSLISPSVRQPEAIDHFTETSNQSIATEDSVTVPAQVFQGGEDLPRSDTLRLLIPPGSLNS